MSRPEGAGVKSALPQIELLDVKSVKPIPRMVVMPVSIHIQDMRDRLDAGDDVGHVIVAQVGSEAYAIDHLDVLFAYREAGRPLVPCHVLPFTSTDEALLSHVFASVKFPVNPFLYGEAVDALRESLGDDRLTGIDPTYMSIHDLPLVPEIRSSMTEYISELGKRHRHIPPFFHIFKSVSKVDRSMQVEAMEIIKQYCDRLTQLTGHFSMPDVSNTEDIMSQFRGKNVKRSGPEPGQEEEGDSDIEVEVNDEAMGFYHEADSMYMDFRCKCGSEYVVNTRKPSVREREDKKDMVVLSGEYGFPMYPIRNDIADYLNLDTKPTVHYYMPFGSDHGKLVFLSRRPMSKQLLEKIRRVIEAHE